MSLQMTDIEVRLPDRKRTSNSFSTKKPIAEVSCIIENGRSREIVVPVRVGRILKEEGIPLPQEEDAAFDAIHELEARVCFTMLTEILSRRDHSCEEVRTKLASYGFRSEEIEPAIAKAQELKFLNDNRFAQYFIDERKRRGWGRRKVELELRRRGIDCQELPGYPDAFFQEEDDLERAHALLKRKSIPSAKAFEKLVRFLLGKGFSYAIAADAVREHLSDSES